MSTEEFGYNPPREPSLADELAAQVMGDEPAQRDLLFRIQGAVMANPDRYPQGFETVAAMRFGLDKLQTSSEQLSAAPLSEEDIIKSGVLNLLFIPRHKLSLLDALAEEVAQSYVERPWASTANEQYGLAA